MSYLPSSPDLNSLSGILTKYPRRGVLLFKLMEDIGRSFSPLSKDSRELIVAYASALNHGACNDHTVKSEESGINEVIIGQLKADIDSSNVDEQLKPILHFVKKLTLTPGKITSKDAQTIFDAGWDEQAFLESVCLCAIANCMNRFTMGIGTDTLGMSNLLMNKA
jgi:alkylhydroperoxidase family enzyme